MSVKIRASRLHAVGLFFCVTGLAMFLNACGSGNGGGGGGGTPPAAAPLSGVVVDSPVANLGYMTDISGLFGKTDATGHFQYRPGDKVKFFLDDPPSGSKPVKRQIGPAAGVDGAPVITMLQLLGATSRTAPEVNNLCRLLLTLGGIPAPATMPIQLPPQLPAALPSPLPSFSSATFDTDLQTAGFSLTVTAPQADLHLASSFSTVTVNFAGTGTGTVSSTPTGINNCSTTCSNTFVNGNAVTLTAVGGGFAGWSAGTGSASGCSGTGPCTFTISSDSTVAATFNLPPPQTLTTLISGNGNVTCSTDGGVTFNQCAAQYNPGTALVLKPTAQIGSIFQNWTDGTGNATVCNNLSGNCSFTLNANSAVTVNFVLNTVTFSLSTNAASTHGGGGSIACSTAGVGGPFAPCAASYNAGTNLTLQATFNSVSNFSGWGSGTESAATCNGSASSLCIFPLTNNSTITANFTRPTLSVVLSGTGTGSVSSSPGGIACTPTCSAVFDKGTPVTLSTSSTGFSGWTAGTGSASCSGTGTCPVTLNVDSSITASFGQVSTFLPNFNFIDAAGNQLLAINPTSPGTPTPVKVGGNIVTMPTTNNRNSGSLAGTITSAAFTAGPPAQFTDIQENTIIFPANGHIYRASAQVSAGVPGNGTNEPAQVSSAAAGLTIGGQTLHTPGMCGVGSANDPTNTNPLIGYNDPGADGLCNTVDDFLVIMHLNDPSTTPPVTFAPGTDIDKHHVFNLANGQLLQLLLTTAGGDLQWIDNSLSPANVTNGVGIGAVTVVATQTDKVFLLSSMKLYIYTPSTHTLALPPVVTVDAGQSWALNGFSNRVTALADINAVYPVQTDGKIFRVPLTTTPGTTINIKHFTPATAITVPIVRASPAKIILQTGTRPFDQNGQAPCVAANNCNNGLLAVDKTTPNTVVTIEAATTSKEISLHSSFNNYVRYSTGDRLGVSPSGAFTRIEDASASAILMSASGNWSDGVLTGTRSIPSNEQTLLRAILIVHTGQQPANGALVQKLDSPTGTPVTLGTVSDPTTQFQSTPFFNNSDNSALLGFANLLANPANTQPFFVDTAVVGSLTKIPVPASAPWADSSQ